MSTYVVTFGQSRREYHTRHHAEQMMRALQLNGTACELIAASNPDTRPDHCPFCDCRNLDCGHPQWHAKSLEPCDGENQCELQEWHCMNCGAAFWC